MSREAHVRFWESAGVKLPGATQLFLSINPTKSSLSTEKARSTCPLCGGPTYIEPPVHVSEGRTNKQRAGQRRPALTSHMLAL